jgi:hypothetical protein
MTDVIEVEAIEIETGRMSHNHPGHEQRMARYIRRVEQGLDIFTGKPYEHKEQDDDGKYNDSFTATSVPMA